MLSLAYSSLVLQAFGTAIGLALMLMLDFTAQRDPADQRAEQLIAAWAILVAAYMHGVLRRARIEAGIGFIAGAAGCFVGVLLYDQHQIVPPPQAFLLLVCISPLTSVLVSRSSP
jgi:hypothetical protein